jgi:apolipoprotein N-acyltransferase
MPTSVEPPDLPSILPYLVVPGLVALIVLLWAKRRGATWTQVRLSFGVAMFGAFLTASGWVFAAYLAGERLTALKILGSQVLVGGACGLLVFFGTMPVERDLTEELGRGEDR